MYPFPMAELEHWNNDSVFLYIYGERRIVMPSAHAGMARSITLPTSYGLGRDPPVGEVGNILQGNHF